MAGLIRFFSLNRWMEEKAQVSTRMKAAAGSENVNVRPMTESLPTPHSIGDQFIMYGGVLMGFLFKLMSTTDFRVDFSKFSLSMLAGAIVIAFAVYPAISNGAKISKDTHFLVRFGIAVQVGIFAPVLMEAAEKVWKTVFPAS